MSIRLRLQATGDLLKHYATVFSRAWQERKAMDGPAYQRLEAQFLPAALSLQETPISPAPRVAMWVLIAFSVCALLWTVFGQIDIVATAQGKIVPNERTKTIQSFDRATVKGIFVEDGQHVKAGQRLLEFDETITASERDRLTRELAGARLQVIRGKGVLTAMDTGKLPTLQRPDGTPDPLWDETNRLLAGTYREYADKMTRLESDQAQHAAELQTTKEMVRKLEMTLPLVSKQADDYKSLSQENFVSNHSYLEKEQARIEMQADLLTQRSRVKELSAALQSAQVAKEALVSETRRVQLDSINDGMVKANSLEQQLKAADSRNQQNILTAPVDGTVQQLAVHTIGGVVKEADPLMLIVPSEDAVEIEATLENKDIGFVKPGQIAEVKVETFQYTKYGTIPAKVLSVSHDAINDEKKGLIYTARIKMARGTIEVDGQQVRLSPGMAVDLEIKTGKRRVIEYFLSPLMQYEHESLKER